MYDRPFRWWVQSVMPLVFDDSLSYYEVLAKLTKYIEGLTGDVEQIEKILATIEGIEDVTQFTEFLERIQAEIGNLDNLQTDTKASLVSAINEVALKADIAYWKPPTGIPESDLSQEVQNKLNNGGSATEYIINNVKLQPAPSNNSPTDLGLGTYTVPDGGIPWNTLSSDVRDRITGAGDGGTTNYDDLNNKPQINGHTLNAGDNSLGSLGLGTYSKPEGGIPESDLSAEVQEKLNTSGGIADSQQTFVASRDYEAGELLYINGVLYKTKYSILAGTNMIPGNNIETTDISAELERINDEIDALQSGAGPDSWNLTTTVQSYSGLEIVDFFEYFNCIGGENYSFIVEPVDPSKAVAYYLDICKRDGTVVLSQHVVESVDYMNRKRFTFVPTDSGEYYCKFYRTASGYPTTISAVKVTIEYTQSQGISELWAQVNAAAQLEPRVSAVEDLVAQHTTQLQALNDIPDKVEELETESDNLQNGLSIGLVPIDWNPAINRGLYIGINDGRTHTSAKYARTNAIWINSGIRDAVILDNDTYEFCLAMYDETGDISDGTGYIGYVGYLTGALYIPKTVAKFGLSFRRVDQAPLADSDIVAIRAALSAYVTTDASLSIEGVAADSKTTGDRLAENREIINANSAQQFVGIENAEKRNWWINQSGVVASSAKGRFFYIPCLANTLYKIDHPKSYRFIVGCFETVPTTGSVPTKAVTGVSADMREETSFILTETATKYLGVYYYNLNYTGGYSEEEAYSAIAVYTGGVDSTLKHEGIAADAKAVGDRIDSVVEISRANRNYYGVVDNTMLVPTYEGVIGLYDALTELYPNYITKHTLTAGGFNNYEYVLTIGNYNIAGTRTRDAVIARPKILISAGMHGYERSAVMSLYKVVESMCENAYDLDDVIYFCEMHVIPIICPWGYDNDVRLNENGVDLNHNFDNTTWTEDATSGAEPGDQPETQIVQNWIDANTDAKIYIDWHNSSFTNEISVLLGADTESNRKIKLDYLHGIDKVIPYWQKEREISASNIYGYTGTTGPGGTAKGYGAEKGLNSFTFETSWNIKSTGKHSNFSIGTGAEAMGNLIKGIRELFL